jgi:hypothetical protein
LFGWRLGGQHGGEKRDDKENLEVNHATQFIGLWAVKVELIAAYIDCVVR